MGYFDSSKNRALWEIRLGELRKEREARQAGGKESVSAEPVQKQAKSATRIPISYQELLKQEAMASEQKKRERGGAERVREKQKAEEHKKEAHAYEKS